MHYFKNLYIFFAILALIIFFFSTTKVNAKAFQINNIEISPKSRWPLDSDAPYMKGPGLKL